MGVMLVRVIDNVGLIGTMAVFGCLVFFEWVGASRIGGGCDL